MEQFFEKISQYNILNYLLPGTVFALLINTFANFKLVQESHTGS